MSQTLSHLTDFPLFLKALGGFKLEWPGATLNSVILSEGKLISQNFWLFTPATFLKHENVCLQI